jgi:3-oxoacyl-[acyl-carrier-protein] synthase II
MKIAEGYAVVAIQREADALSQSRKPLASLLGYGETSDSHHLTQPHPGGEGAARAARAALSAAQLPPQGIGLVSAHATSTPNNDAAEFAGLSLAFGNSTKDLPVVAFKSHVGHTLGGAGATELILSLLALRDQTFPPTANTAKDDLEFPVRVNLDAPRLIDIAATMNLSLGFGGSNAAMILGRYGPATAKEQSSPGLRPVLITGVGVVAPNAIGNEAFLRQLAEPAPASSNHLDDSQISHLLNARRVRRMSEYVKATLAATTVACQNAAITDIPAFAAVAAAVLGTCLGSSSFCESYYRPITKDGLAAANPALFAEGVPNAGAAQLSLMFQVKGPCQTIIGSRTAGVEALYLAALRIASGEWDRAIVSAGEEFHETAVDIYKALGLYAGGPPTPRAPRGTTLSTGAVTFILESESSAQSRAAQPYAEIKPTRSGAIRADSPAALPRTGASLFSRIGAPRHLITSTNGTWLDRIEAATIRSLPRVIAGSVDGLLPDLASANSLAGLAATLLTGRVPGSTHPEPVVELGVLATDYAGLTSCVGVKILRGPGHP